MDRAEAFYFFLLGDEPTQKGESPPGRLYSMKKTIRDSIDDAATVLQKEKDQVLRSDAKLLLYINFVQMVAIPLQLGEVAANQVKKAMQADISLLIESALDTDEVKDTHEISGHSIINSLSRNWNRMKIAQFKLWEGQ